MPKGEGNLLVEGMVHGGVPLTYADPTILKHLLELVDAGTISPHEVIKMETGSDLSPSTRQALTAKLEVEVFKIAQKRLFAAIVQRERVRLWKESTPWYKRLFRRKP